MTELQLSLIAIAIIAEGYFITRAIDRLAMVWQFMLDEARKEKRGEKP